MHEALGGYTPKTPSSAEVPPPHAPDPIHSQPSAQDEADEYVTLRIPRHILAQLVKETIMNQNANKSDANNNAKSNNPNPTNDNAAGETANNQQQNRTTDAGAASTPPNPQPAAAVSATKRSLKNLPWSKIGKTTAAAVGALALGAGGFFLARKYNVPGLSPVANSMR